MTQVQVSNEPRTHIIVLDYILPNSSLKYSIIPFMKPSLMLLLSTNPLSVSLDLVHTDFYCEGWALLSINPLSRLAFEKQTQLP